MPTLKENFKRATISLTSRQREILLEILTRIKTGTKLTKKSIRDLSGVDYRNMGMSDIAKALGTSRQQIMDWTNRGCPRGSGGGYSLPELWLWRTKQLQSSAGDLEDDLKKERVEKLRIENAINRNEYIPRGEVRDRMISIFSAVSSMVRRAIKLASPLVVGSTSPHQNEKILESQYKNSLRLLKENANIQDW